MTSIFIRQAEIDGKICDVRLHDSRIEAISGSLDSPLEPRNNETVIEAKGNALLPGLHDHHIHLAAMAASLNSVFCGPPEISTRQELAEQLNRYSNDETEWLRGTGYYPVGGEMIDRHWLDQNGPARPIRIQHRSGRLWIFNSAGIEKINHGDKPVSISDNGHVYDDDNAVHQSLGGGWPDLAPLIERLLAFGITGVTDVTPRNDPPAFRYLENASRPLKITIMGRPDITGLSGRKGSSVGPVKLHYHDHDLPPLSALTAEISRAHAQGRAVASHCVTLGELMLTLAALEEAGAWPEDRIEHAALASDAAIDWIARLGIGVATQPHFIKARADAYKHDVAEQEQAELWRLASFINQGIAIGGGSDAPFGSLDPWAAMDAATARPDIFPQLENISPEQALALYTKPAKGVTGSNRRVTTGAMADLCLLATDWKTARQNLASVRVAVTFIDGVAVYQAS